MITEYIAKLMQLLRFYHVLTAEVYDVCIGKQFVYLIKFCLVDVINLSHSWDRQTR